MTTFVIVLYIPHLFIAQKKGGSDLDIYIYIQINYFYASRMISQCIRGDGKQKFPFLES